MAMENLSIAQHRNTLRYAHIRSGAYRPQLRRFWQGVHIYFQCEAPTTLNVRTGRTILWVKEVLLSGLLLENNDGKECREHSKNCAPYHLPIESTIHLELAIVLEDFHILCVERRNEWLLCSCVISVNVVGTWYACSHP